MISATGQKEQYMRCRTRGCQTKAAKTRYVEDKVLNALRQWLSEYEVKLKQQNDVVKHSTPLEFFEKSLGKLNREHDLLLKQKSSLHDLLEQGVYTKDDFLERAKVLAEKLDGSRTKIEELSNQLEQVRSKVTLPKDIVPETRRVIDLYCATTDAAKKNGLLKSLLDYAVYTKSKSQREDDFVLTIYPKLPQEKVCPLVTPYT